MKRGHKRGNKIPKVIPDFIQVPYQVFSDNSLSSTDKFVYGAIYFFYNTTVGKKCTASNETIADLIKTTSTTVSNSLIILDKGGYINRLFFDETHRRRKEIIPLVVVTKLPKNKTRVKPQSVTISPKLDTPESGINTPESGINTPESGTLINTLKSPINSTGIELNELLEDNLDTPESGEREKEERITRKNNKIDYRPSPSDIVRKDLEPSGDFTKKVRGIMRYEKLTDVPEKDVSDGIALFLPVFPDQFVTKNPFAVRPNRDAVKKVLMRLTLDELGEIIGKYVAKKGHPYRPEAATIASFCNFKMDRIEVYVGKSAGGLWAQRSISTPVQRADSDEQLAKIISERREKQRKNKEEWDKEHPLEK